ncbi:PDR/VanB family oxidoreductase [Oceanibacterium hippocampi]|uniref:Phenoxybenzoate dioxygenase subunit beta n=1 Tax=Oceanibacterium hippocampi TaxID=745714 RepID=A0A1Y5TS73_9PROT|nr:PDR/VanB family oxidoreductase [Oceanibacterium hippocampi]SLN70980.1 Phenoxybenzoate dioxygenase subunit beta [Oceanibacterium hippocampi]
MNEQQQRLRVSDIRAEARDVLLVELRSPDGGALPPFEPGAHLEIVLPNGLIRHYSLANDSRERDRYLIGVGRAENSRGGSDHVHREIRCGQDLTVTGPRNNFPLAPHGGRYVFVAGGIGITPIMAMIRWCAANGRDWHLHYASRSRQRAAFYEELRVLGGDRVSFHFDDETGHVLDAKAALATPEADETVYCCGPQPLMQAVEAATVDRPEGSVRFEYFTAPASDPAASGEATGFSVHLQKSGRTLTVPADKSILEVLEENGFSIPFSCREGLCRTCETKVCAGDIEHRDYVLSDEEQQAGDTMMLCVSRAKSDSLVLDL